MSHTRFALGFPRHRKVNRLTDAAFRLWVSAMDHAREQASDGFLDETDLDLVPRCPAKGARRDALVKELVDGGLWEVRTNGWQVHDFLDWQDSSEQIRARRENARHRMKRIRDEVRSDVRTNMRRTNDVVANEVRSGTSYSSSVSDRSGSGSGSPEGDPGEPPPEPVVDGETVCPLNLLDRPGVRAMLRELSEKLPAPLVSLEAEARDFLSYWTLGEGQGRTRANWPRVLRERLRKRHVKGELKAPGAAEHERNGGHRRGMSPEAARFFETLPRSAP